LGRVEAASVALIDAPPLRDSAADLAVQPTLWVADLRLELFELALGLREDQAFALVVDAKQTRERVKNLGRLPWLERGFDPLAQRP
jgi:hypothetical protein